ncbi:MAG: hypothetical protein ACK6CT_05205 [Planctomycetia bacterium]
MPALTAGAADDCGRPPDCGAAFASEGWPATASAGPNDAATGGPDTVATAASTLPIVAAPTAARRPAPFGCGKVIPSSVGSDRVAAPFPAMRVASGRRMATICGASFMPAVRGAVADALLGSTAVALC